MQRVNVIGKSRQEMADLMRADGVQVVRQTLREVGGGQYRVQALGEATAFRRLTKAGYDVEHVEDLPPGDAADRAARDRPYLAAALALAHGGGHRVASMRMAGPHRRERALGKRPVAICPWTK